MFIVERLFLFVRSSRTPTLNGTDCQSAVVGQMTVAFGKNSLGE